jgi:hypothetical protein
MALEKWAHVASDFFHPQRLYRPTYWGFTRKFKELPKSLMIGTCLHFAFTCYDPKHRPNGPTSTNLVQALLVPGRML